MFTPTQAWDPLPTKEFDEAAQRHLLRRAGFAADPRDREELKGKTPEEAVAWLMDRAQPFETTKLFKDWQEKDRVPNRRAVEAAYKREQEGKTMMEKDEGRKASENARNKDRAGSEKAYLSLGHHWLKFASDHANSPRERLVNFLENVFVVDFSDESGYDAGNTELHQRILRTHLGADYEDICRAIMRSPAMIEYLNLKQSVKGAPNENFARELMELFMLGEGQGYTEDDIKEAARAFTGYGYEPETLKFVFDKERHDDTPKKIFGVKRDYDGDQVIKQILRLEPAKVFIPRLLCQSYVNDQALPPEYIAELGSQWAANRHNFAWLHRRILASRMFFHTANRGRIIKSPYHFYLGMLQDLQLDLVPLRDRVLRQLSIMGQQFYRPPNVSGWDGGLAWINNSTVNVRRVLVETLFLPLDEGNLNADEKKLLEADRAEGKRTYSITTEMLENYAQRQDADIVSHLCNYFLPIEPAQGFRDAMAAILADPKIPRPQRVRQVILAVLQSPYYQVC